MKRLAVLTLMLLLPSLVHAAWAYETILNPDRYPSVGIDFFQAQVAGIPRAGVDGKQSDGQSLGATLDFKLPVSNYLTLHAFGENQSVDNNKAYTDGYRIGVGVRVYIIR